MFLRVAFLSLLFVNCAFAKERMTFIYYYAWYANPTYDGQWLHWQDYGHHPPQDVSSAFYPKLEAYSSDDPWIIHQHMKWIAKAKINVVIYSWWGQNDPTNTTAEAVLDAAADYNLSVAFMIEPYFGRTTRSICDDIDYLQQRFGRHPAFFKLAYQTAYNSGKHPSPVFFIYQPEYSRADLSSLADHARSSSGKPLILFQSTDANFMSRTHADGIFAYEAVQPIMNFYDDITRAVREKHGFFVACVSPGFNINKTTGTRSLLFQSRRSGRSYDQWWEKAISADSEFVAIISFNEWHEGTQIEPADNKRDPPHRYLTYQGAFGKRGRAAEESYLLRTARWIDILQQLP
jgi:hypothetical protein